jgi:putative redox protein
MAHATATTGLQNYRTDIQCGQHVLVADEPASRGGQDTGASPSELVAAALASCTAITLRMYAERKQWPLQSVRVDAELRRHEDKSTSIDRVLRLEGMLTDEQRARLADIAERTPVTLTLKSGATIRTTLAQ